MKDYKKIVEGVIDILKSTEDSGVGIDAIGAYIEESCPELKMPDDETVRKALVEYFAKGGDDATYTFVGVQRNHILAWLDKQQRNGMTDAWTKKDDDLLNTALWHVSYSITNGKNTDCQCDTTEWLKSLKDRIAGTRI